MALLHHGTETRRYFKPCARLQELEVSLAESRKEVDELRKVNAKASAKNKELEDELAKVSHAHDEAVQVPSRCMLHSHAKPC